MPLPALEALVADSKWIWLAICGSLLLIWRSRLYKLPAIPQTYARDLRGQICFVTNGMQPVALSSVERLLNLGVKVVLLLPAETAKSDETLQLFAILQNNSPSSRNPNLFIESLDITSPDNIIEFAKKWEKQGVVRTGALNEAIQGRQHVCGLIFFPGSSSKDNLNLARALLPSFERTAKEAGHDPLLGRADAQTRVIQVVETALYAAHGGKVATEPKTKTPAALSSWGATAKEGILAAKAFHDEQKSMPQSSSTIFLTLSLGFTASEVRNLASIFAPDAQPGNFLINWAILLLQSIMVVASWLFGKSAAEAASIIDWALLAPSRPIPGDAQAPYVRAGALYREGIDARRVPEWNDRVKTDAPL